MSKPIDNQNKTKEVLKIPQKIIQNSSDGDYIYRGDPAHYKRIPSFPLLTCVRV